MGPLRVLFVEDNHDDARLLERALEGAYAVTCRRVETAAALAAALTSAPPDLVISDWSLPQFDGLAAFRVVRAHDLDVPFIIVSGTIGEDIAVDALKAGVHDFMSKGAIARLLPAVERELREAGERRLRRAHEREIERQRADLAHSARLLRAIIDRVPEGVVMIDPAGRVALHNQALASFGGAPDATGELRPHGALFATDQVTPYPAARVPATRALAGEEVDEDVFIRHPGAPDGMWASISARPLRAADDGIIGAVATLRDTTRERAAQEQLMIYDRMASIGILAAGVGHEINNPLAAALVNLELAAAAVEERTAIAGDDLAELRSMLGDALEAAERVKEIVRDLRIFARHEEVALGPVSLERVLASSLRMAWNEVRHRARLARDYAGAPLVLGAEHQLGQLFLNLIVNAAHAIPEGQAGRNQIRVAARAEDTRVVVEIADTGAGIPPEAMARLFTPFFTTKPAGVGTGLGLAICQRIVRSHGGAIEVESEVGVGTIFRVSLPRAIGAEPPRPARTPRASEPPAPGRRGRVLVIDDDRIVTSAIARALTRTHEVTAETRAVAALGRILRGERFDLILCDLMMPEMSGVEVHAELERVAPDQAARMVFMTGGAFTSAAREFLARVPNPRVEKPFGPPQLRALVAERLPWPDPRGSPERGE